jgi:hypothetical protein
MPTVYRGVVATPRQTARSEPCVEPGQSIQPVIPPAKHLPEIVARLRGATERHAGFRAAGVE